MSDDDVTHASDVSSDFSGPRGDSSGPLHDGGELAGFDPANDEANSVRERVVKYTYEDAVEQGFDDAAAEIRRAESVTVQEKFAEELHGTDGFEATFSVREEVYGR